MQFLRNVPIIKIMNNTQDFTITSLQKFDEDEDRIIIRCAEYVSNFVRGFVCDMACNFIIVEENGIDKGVKQTILIPDLVLVHIRKEVICGDVPQFEYVFYK